jgi:FxsC-like protein
MVALFVLSYARKDGERLVKKFFDRLSARLSDLRPTAPEVGFMDTDGIPTGANWPQKLGGQLATAPVLVPLFSPRYFTREECGREIQAFLERIRLFEKNNPGAGTPLCIIPVVWEWENLTIHPALRDIHYGNPNYPPKYRERKSGLRVLADLDKNRDHFKTFCDALGSAINLALNAGAALPPIAVDYRTLPNAFESPNPSNPASGTRSVRFAYVAALQSELRTVRRNQTTYSQSARDWRAFDPVCPGGIGILSEGVAAELTLAHDTIPLDEGWSSQVDAAGSANGQVVFIVDSWAARVARFDPIFAELDQEKYRSCPVLVPLNARDEENNRERSELLDALSRKLPGRAAAKGNTFVPGIADEVEYQQQLARILAARQSELIGAATARTGSAPLPMI